MNVRHEDASDLFDGADHLAGEIETPFPRYSPPHYARSDTNVRVFKGPRKQPSFNGHTQGRRDESEPVDDRVHLSGCRRKYRCDWGERDPCLSVRHKPTLDFGRTEVHEMLEPRASNDTVKLRRRRIEPLAQLFDFVNGTCLERALRLHFRRDVYKPNGKASRHFLPSRGEEGLHGWLARRNPKDAKTLHRPQANILRASKFRAPVCQRVDGCANDLRSAFTDLVKAAAEVRP